jgi:hypothetical protein
LPGYLEIDKLPDGTYRATVGTLFEQVVNVFARLAQNGAGIVTLAAVSRAALERG